MNEANNGTKITLTLTYDEILILRNCIDRIIRDKERELITHSCDGTRKLLTELYPIEKKFTEIWNEGKEKK